MPCRIASHASGTNESSTDDRPAVVRADRVLQNHDEERGNQTEHEVGRRSLGSLLQFSFRSVAPRKQLHRDGNDHDDGARFGGQ
jgi:hypothetical protein